MPTSLLMDETISLVNDQIIANLGQKKSLEKRIISASKNVLMQNIEFVVGSQASSLMEKIKMKYPPLKNEEMNGEMLNITENLSKIVSGETNSGDRCYPLKNALEIRERKLAPHMNGQLWKEISLQWQVRSGIGAGMENMGNTCFLNSTLQCLTYTAPLANHLVAQQHSMQCQLPGFCMLCELERHIKRCFHQAGRSIRPQSILQKLKMIAKQLQYGRQEDAHEFLRCVVDSMQKSLPKKSTGKSDRNLVTEIFGGSLRSMVSCMQCRKQSCTWDPFLDISLDIKNTFSILKAFERFVRPEMLSNDNAYNCAFCRQKVTAQKKFTIHQAPNVLTVQLKRFDFNRFFGGKVTKHVAFEEKLNLRPFMSSSQGTPVSYRLYAVLVHVGGSCNSGHYYSYVKSPSGLWYCMNDSHVQQVSIHRVLQAEAYLLFYIADLPVRSVGASTNITKCAELSKRKSVPPSGQNSGTTATPLFAPRILSVNKPQNKHNHQKLVMTIKSGKVTTEQPKKLASCDGGKLAEKALKENKLDANRMTSNPDTSISHQNVFKNGSPTGKKSGPLISRLSENIDKELHSSLEKKILSDAVQHNDQVQGLSDLNATTQVPGSYKPLLSPGRDHLWLNLNGSSNPAWNVKEQVSPSIGSGSSNTSVNSTSEWHISASKASLVSEAQHSGWTVMSPPKSVISSTTSTLTTPASSPRLDGDAIRKPRCENGKGPKDIEYFSKRKDRERGEAVRLDSTRKRERSCSPATMDGENIEVNNTDRLHGREASDEIDEPDKKRKKKKKKKKKSRLHENKIECDKNVNERRRDEADDYEWVEKTKESSDSSKTYQWDKKKDLQRREESHSYGSRMLAPNYLNQESSAFSNVFSSNVSRWDGSRSQNEYHQRGDNNSRPMWCSEYEEELDRGKAKKIHRDNVYEQRYRTFGNPFQRHIRNNHEWKRRFEHNQPPENNFARDWSRSGYSRNRDYRRSKNAQFTRCNHSRNFDNQHFREGDRKRFHQSHSGEEHFSHNGRKNKSDSY